VADNWAFVGVIDTDGFLSAELRELRGKDFQQVLLFADDFTIGSIEVFGLTDVIKILQILSGVTPSQPGYIDMNGNSKADMGDVLFILRTF